MVQLLQNSLLCHPATSHGTRRNLIRKIARSRTRFRECHAMGGDGKLLIIPKTAGAVCSPFARSMPRVPSARLCQKQDHPWTKASLQYRHGAAAVLLPGLPASLHEWHWLLQWRHRGFVSPLRLPLVRLLSVPQADPRRAGRQRFPRFWDWAGKQRVSPLSRYSDQTK